MEALGLIVLAANLLTVAVMVVKMAELSKKIQENRRIQNRIELAARENAQTLHIILDELEEKLDEAKNVIRQLHEGVNKTALGPAIVRDEMDNSKPIKGKAYSNEQFEEEREKNSSLPALGTKIFFMKEQGFSIQEIAERLNIPQGEISLKLNLREKQQRLMQK